MGQGLQYWIVAIVLSFLSGILVRIFLVFWWTPLQLKKCLESQGIKGPPYQFFRGNILDIAELMTQSQAAPMASWSHDILQRVTPHFHVWSKTYGKEFVFWAGNQARLYLGYPALTKDVLMDKSGSFGLKVRHPNPQARHLLGNGLAGLSGDKWAKHRKIVNPAFHIDRLKGMIPCMEDSCDNMLETWMKNVLDHSPEVDLLREFKALTADVISRTAFGSSYEEGKQIFDLQGQQVLLTLQLFRSVYIPGFRFLPTKINQQCWRLEKEIRRRLKALIYSKHENPTDDLLALLLAANKEQHGDDSQKTHMTIDEIIDECKTFYLAGHETTAALLTWTMILLAMHQDWQDKARQEVLQVCGKHDYPDVESISRLNIVGMVLNEVLRLYPPAVFVVREASKPTKLGDLFIPAGTQVLVPIISLHHDPDLWGEDVNIFNPERFSKGITNAAKHPMAFLPFGFGPRICIGQNFTLLEAKVVLAMILQRFSFILSPSYNHAPKLLLTLQPQHGGQVILQMI